MSLRENIGNRIKEIRGPMSQSEFAEAIGVDRKTVSNYESGKRIPDPEVIVTLYDKWGVQPLWLLSGKGPESRGKILSAAEIDLVEMFRYLDKEHQRSVRLTVLAMFERADRLGIKGAGREPADE